MPYLSDRITQIPGFILGQNGPRLFLLHFFGDLLGCFFSFSLIIEAKLEGIILLSP